VEGNDDDGRQPGLARRAGEVYRDPVGAKGVPVPDGGMREDENDTAGDAVCWISATCEGCGALVEDATCWNCGAPRSMKG
jgi:hypothetical protein